VGILKVIIHSISRAQESFFLVLEEAFAILFTLATSNRLAHFICENKSQLHLQY
jgi:hypothetical protein